MIIERTAQQSILPEAVDVLETVKEIHNYHSDYNQRPPLGIYNVALSKVLDNFIKVLDALDEMLVNQPYRDESQYGTRFDAPIIEAQEHLLKAIKEHFDACMDVLRCFYPPSIGNKRKLFWAEKPVELYWNAIQDDFFQPISKVVNALKHDSRHLKFIIMFNDDVEIPGYFVESVDGNGRILPDRSIHEPVRSLYDYNSGYDTGFSFYRDLRYLFCCVYIVSNHLAKSVFDITGYAGKLQFPKSGTMDEKAINAAKRIATLPIRFYADEVKVGKKVPTVKLLVDTDRTRLRVCFPDLEQPLISGHGPYMALSTIVSDGISTMYKLPYSTGGEL